MGMLVLGRKVGQSIRIGPDITITITRLIGDQVGVGISAPKTLSIMRSELPNPPAKEKADNAR